MYRCPYCTKSRRFWKLSDGRRKCVACGYRFTYYQRGFRKTGKHLIRLADYFCLGVPAYRLRFRLPLSLRVIEGIFHHFRLLIYYSVTKELERLSGKLELDEASFGGKRKGKRGWGAEGKVLVFGIYQRNGRVITFPVPNRRKRTLLPLINRHTRNGSIYYTDDYEGYTSVAVKGEHVVILKEEGRPIKKMNINGIEGFWSYAKTWLYHYRGVPKKNFHLYLKEIEWRYNNREKDLLPILLKLIRG